MKKTIALIIATLLIDIAVISSYVMPVEASAPALPFDGLYNSFSQIFGNAWGYFKSTDEMTYNMTMDKLQEIYEALNRETPELLEGTGISSNILVYDEMLNELQNSYQQVVDYNSGATTNEFYDKLNEQSYQSSGTLATKTLEEKLQKSIAFIKTMAPQYYETQMDIMFESLLTAEGALQAHNLKENYLLYESFMNTWIAGQEIGAINTAWFTPVENSVYSLLDLNKGVFNFNGIDFPIYQTNKLEYFNNEMTIRYVLSTNRKAIFMPYYSSLSGSFEIAVASDGPFTLSIVYYNNDGSVNWSTSSTASEYKTGLYTTGFGMGRSNNIPFSYGTLPDSYRASELDYSFYDYYYSSLFDVNFSLDNAESVSVKAPGLTLALDSFWNKDLAAEDVVNLADDLAQVGTVAGTDTGIATLTDVVSGLTITLPDSITDAKNDVVTAVEGVGEKILTLPKAIWLEFADVLEGIKAKAEAIDTTKPWEGDFDSNSNDFVIILNGLMLLIMIILALLRIFIHCLQFIVNIFKIPASTAFLPDEVIAGLDYIKTLTIPGLGMSVYSFMMGLVYIMIVFYAVKVLRVNVDRLRVPKSRNGGMH